MPACHQILIYSNLCRYIGVHIITSAFGCQPFPDEDVIEVDPFRRGAGRAHDVKFTGQTLDRTLSDVDITAMHRVYDDR